MIEVRNGKHDARRPHPRDLLHVRPTSDAPAFATQKMPGCSRRPFVSSCGGPATNDYCGWRKGEFRSSQLSRK
jgi:hypothetical protein